MRFKQEKDWTCGPAAMRYILHSFGIRKSEANLALAMKSSKKIGTSHRMFPKLAKKMNLDYVLSKKYNFSDLEKALRGKYKVIVCYYDVKEKYGHYACVRKLDKNYIYLADPYYGNIKLRLEHFRKIWHGKHVPKGWFIGLRSKY